MTILDGEKGIRFDREDPPLGNAHALRYLPVGLHMIARTVRTEENAVIKRHGGRPPVIQMFGFPNIEMLACSFNWFSVSLVSYLRLVSLIGLMSDKSWKAADLENPANHRLIREYCVSYIREVAPAVYLWRNKVAAHAAATDPRETDNLATLEYSLMAGISYTAPHYVAGSFVYVNAGGESSLEPWSLSQVFEDLAPRFWPEARLDPLRQARR